MIMIIKNASSNFYNEMPSMFEALINSISEVLAYFGKPSLALTYYVTLSMYDEIHALTMQVL